MHDEMKDDVGVEFGNPGVELHSLPPYDTFRLISDHANILAVTFAIVSIAITALLWRFVRSREEEQFDFSHPPGSSFHFFFFFLHVSACIENDWPINKSWCLH